MGFDYFSMSVHLLVSPGSVHSKSEKIAEVCEADMLFNQNRPDYTKPKDLHGNNIIAKRDCPDLKASMASRAEG